MKLSRTLRVGVCVILLLGWLHATAQTTATAATPLTMQQAVELALRQNPTLLAAQRNLESIRAEEISAGTAAESGVQPERHGHYSAGK